MLMCFLIQAVWWWAVVQAQDLDYPNIMLESEHPTCTSSSEQWNPCPGERRCSCQTTEVDLELQTIVLCNNRSLNEVPTKLPNNTVCLDLSSNYIRTLGTSSFKGYPDLINLTLAQNQLTQIKGGSFDGLQKLEYLSFRSNLIRYNASGFQPGSFKPLVSLKTLNIQENFTRNDFREESYDLKALSDLVKLKTLYLDGMPFKNLGKVFENLDSLTEIIFDGKWGRCLIWEMTPDFFPRNTFLKRITIQNCEMKHIQAKSFARLSHLLYLDLSFNEELTFSCMKNLTDGLNTQIEVIKLNKLHSTLGPCVVLTTENLRGFDNLALKEIHLESNRIATLEKTAAKYIPNTLETISVRDNSFRMDTYVFHFLSRNTFSNLRNFIFSDQYTNHIFPAFQTPNQSQTERQIDSRTKRDKKAILYSLPSDIQKQNKSYNNKMDLTAKLHRETPTTVEKDKKIYMKTAIKMINDVPITKRHSEDDVKKKSAPDESFTTEGMTDSKKEQAVMLRRKIAKWMQGFPITLPENFTKLDASNNKICLALHNFKMTVPNNLREINIRRNLYWAWVGPFEGFQNLTKLDISWNFCSYMTLNVLKDMPNLETLNIGGNFLDASLNSDKNGTIFQNQERLTFLILSDNKLQTLPKNIFMGLKNLLELDLAKNLLKTFEADLSHMNQLQILNLSDNQLETISESARKVFDQQAHANYFALNLENNNFKCDCENLDFIKWISESPVKFMNFRNYVCYFKDRTQGNLTNAANIYQTLAEECTNYTPVIVSSTAALVLVLSLTAAAMVYRYRWNLRYLYYMTKYKAKTAVPSRIGGYELIESGEEYLKEVNVSYADEDCGFVRQKIYTELEVNRGLKLHIRDRDNPVDERFISDNIMDAIESTKKTLIIMSKAYLKHKWCIFEMNMAGIKALKTDKNMLCVLLLEEVSHRDLPLKIMKIIKDQEHIEYPRNENLQDCYWDRLKNALTRF